MKVLGIMGSARRDGNTNDLLDEALKGAAEGGAQVMKIILADYYVHPIFNCKDCQANGGCAPDDFPYIWEEIVSADGLIWASPLYWYSVSGLMKVLLDRLSCAIYLHGGEYFHEKMKEKASAIIVTQEEAGIEPAQHLLGTMKMVFAYPGCQWTDLGYVQGLGGSRGTSLKDIRLVQAAYELGQKFARFETR